MNYRTRLAPVLLLAALAVAPSVASADAALYAATGDINYVGVQTQAPEPVALVAQADLPPDPAPVVLDGDDAPIEKPSSGVPLAPIVLALTVLSAILPMTSKLPGWGTLSNIATGVIAALLGTFTDAAQAHPTMTWMALGLAALGAVVGYFRSEKRAAGTPEAEERVAELRGA